MAIINASFNTETKEFNVTLDGNPVSNVEYFSVYNYCDTPSLEMRTKPEKIQGMIVYQHVCANEKGLEIKEKTENALSKSLAGLMKKNQL